MRIYRRGVLKKSGNFKFHDSFFWILNNPVDLEKFFFCFLFFNFENLLEKPFGYHLKAFGEKRNLIGFKESKINKIRPRPHKLIGFMEYKITTGGSHFLLIKNC